ncbi:FMRFamide receptor [Strongyloides ratti]|uniref:FMRFamide receptor n=1 Tax=Strongyloides ratti TaxID=34506 RepID=A0A090MW00_STRRB|nr:FMRFamide receptor [Strongyloides ratti]CEF63263.1 FMRFamide receptor [Strongyloides ratti]
MLSDETISTAPSSYSVSNDTSIILLSEPGIIPFLPNVVNFIAPNATECVCQDLQIQDYTSTYEWFNFILIILALPSLSVFGVITNFINLYIYSRHNMQNSANTYLLFLGCSDFLVIVTGLFIFWIDSARSYIQQLARGPYTTVYTLPFGYMAQTCSIYFTVAAAVDCYVKVCWKRFAEKYCTVSTARKICASVALGSILYNSLRFPQFNLRSCLHTGSQEIVIEICPTTLFFTINTIYNIYMYMVLMTLLPFMLLLVLNAFIVVKQSIKNNNEQIRRISTSEDVLSANSSNQTTTIVNTKSEKKQNAGDDTVTMIMVVVLFLCCNTLALIVNLIETFFEPDPLLLNFLSDASNFLVIFNSSVNCVIYIIFNKEYREEFINLFSNFNKLCCKKSSCNECSSDNIIIKDTKLILNKEIPSNEEKSEVSSPIWKLQTLSNDLIQNNYNIYNNNKWNEEIAKKSKYTSYNPQNYEFLLVDNDFEADSGLGGDSNGELQNHSELYLKSMTNQTFSQNHSISLPITAFSNSSHHYIRHPLNRSYKIEDFSKKKNTPTHSEYNENKSNHRVISVAMTSL